MSELTVETRDVEGVTLLYPRGFINAHTVRQFEGEIQKALAQGHFKIVVSCSGLAYIASAGLGALMGAIEEIRGNGGDLGAGDDLLERGLPLQGAARHRLVYRNGRRRLAKPELCATQPSR